MSGIILATYAILSWLLYITIERNHFVAEKSNSRTPLKILFFCLPPLIIGFYFIALKPFSAGGDTISYLIAFSKISNPLYATVDAGYGSEVLFWPLQALLKTILNERGWLIANFFLVSILNFFAYRKINEDSNLTPLIFVLVFLTFYTAFSGNAMRQIYAIPLGAIAFHYAYQRNYIKFILYTTLAIGFHWSSFLLIVAPVICRIPPKTIYYIAVPLIALACSSLISLLSDLLLLTGFEWLTDKTNAYIRGGVVSHISAIWMTLTFWYCIVIYICYIFFKIHRTPSLQSISQYLLMLMATMLFSIEKTDVADRYMAVFLFFTPIAITAIIQKLNTTNFWKNSILTATFATAGILVYTSDSITAALGIRY